MVVGNRDGVVVVGVVRVYSVVATKELMFDASTRNETS
jgi:hypothetical protein